MIFITIIIMIVIKTPWITLVQQKPFCTMCPILNAWGSKNGKLMKLDGRRCRGRQKISWKHGIDQTMRNLHITTEDAQN